MMSIQKPKQSQLRARDERTRNGRMKTRFMGLVMGSAMLASSAFTAPRMTIPEAEFDFGFVPQNSSISHVFWLHSKGDDSLRIISVQPG